MSNKAAAGAGTGMAGEGGGQYRGALIALTSLFFMWGLITSLNDILIPHLKAAFQLTYLEAMLIQFCFFGAYFMTSLPAGLVVERLGYRRGIVLGLAIAALGCLLFYPAATLRHYPLFLAALFVLASGITMLQVAANPLVTMLGAPATASSRLTLTQAFNSLGTTVGPLLGATLILGSAAVVGPDSVKGPYLGLAATLCALALALAMLRLPLVGRGVVMAAGAGLSGERPPSLWRHRPLVLGIAAIFLYVGGEVSIGSFLVNFLGEPDVAGLGRDTAGSYLSFYWGGAMVGRFVGSVAMTRVRPAKVLAFNAAVAIALITLAMVVRGSVAMWAMLAVGLCNSVMFPTIFALAIEGLGSRTGEGSGLLCTAIVGGALVPLLQGGLADRVGVVASFVVPIVCYVYIVTYGVLGSRGTVAARV